jgi:hypothetical protein
MWNISDLGLCVVTLGYLGVWTSGGLRLLPSLFRVSSSTKEECLSLTNVEKPSFESKHLGKKNFNSWCLL